MGYLQFVPDLFLEVAELNRFSDFLDKNGFRKALLEDSVSFGLIKSAADSTFANGRVQKDVDDAIGQKTIKINPIQAINSDGNFIVSTSLISGIPVPGDGDWYWVKIAHAYTSQEKGTVAVDAVGNLTGTATEFTKILRGQPNFPSRIKFMNSVGNLLEYDVLEVTDDTHAVIVHPAVTLGGDAVFISESGLNFEVVGTFTPGVAVPDDNKMPFRYDSYTLELVVEPGTNIVPTHTTGQEFFLARVRVTNGILVVQDKRTEYWETKASAQNIAINRTINALIGVESIKYQNTKNTGDNNIVQIAWGMRTSNWSVDSSQNIVTMFGSATGGSYKDTTAFVDGDFNGWRLYTSNGKYRVVISSVKQGSAINLSLDVLDVNDFSTDGGTTFIAQEILCVPDCEEVQVKFTADPADKTNDVDKVFTFPVNTSLADCLVTPYKDPTSLFNVQYRYKSFKEYTTWAPIVSGSYFTEASYDALGNILASDQRVIYTYVSDPTAGFVQLTLGPNSYAKFIQKVYKGDLIGVNTISAFSPGQVLQLVVGVDKRYQHVVGNISLNDDLYISLSALNAVEGNEFRIHIDCTALSLGGNRIIIANNYAGGTLNVLKTFTQADVYQMLNQDGGLVFDCVFDNQGKWIISENYDIGTPFEVKALDGIITDMFDTTSGMGIVKGLFGYCLCNAARSVGGITVPNLSDRFIVGAGNTYVVGAEGGEATHKLLVGEMPAHSHPLGASGSSSTHGTGSIVQNGSVPTPPADTTSDVGREMGVVGADEPHNNLPPYHALIYAKRVF